MEFLTTQWPAIIAIFACFAVGDFISTKTGAKISSVFVALMLFLALFMTGIFPKDIMAVSGLSGAQKVAGTALVFHMGTNINLTQLKKEWRTLVLAVISMVVALAGLLAVTPIIGLNAAVICAPIVNGGIAATDIMVGAALEKGATLAAALGTLAFAVQKFVGTVPASRCGLNEAHDIVNDIRAKHARDPNYSWYDEQRRLAGKEGVEDKVPFWKKNSKLWTTYTCLFIVYFVNLISINLAKLTGGWISNSIWGLILGVLASEAGLVPPRILEHAKCSGFFMVLAYVNIIASLANVSFADLGSVALSLFLVFAAVIAATYLFVYVLGGWKIVGSKNLSIGICMAQLLGYPATYLISQEIAKAVGETQEEIDAITARIEPAYVIAGFATVTSLSVVMAGFLVNFVK